tara:strand:+ start:341 stop:838 length:498 start_codon:yes stop_codon:yes gene_type:complete
MNFVIRVENGQPVDHPIAIENFRQAFPHLDENNLPPEFVAFERVPQPVLGPYEMMDSLETTYQWVDGVLKDVWPVRPMTPEEKALKIAAMKSFQTMGPNAEQYAAWTFDEEKCVYVPPYPKPNDGKNYFWQGTTNTWVEKPQRPNDGKAYIFEHASATWVEVIQP